VLRRVADHLYWAARYLERAQWRARLVDVNYNLNLEVPPRAADPWEPLLGITGEREPFAHRYAQADEASVVDFFTFDRDNSSSIRSCIEAARTNLSALRNIISSEMWLQMNELYLDSRNWSPGLLANEGFSSFFTDLRNHFYSITGIIRSTMPRDLSYDFLEIGTMLERADNVARLLDVKYHYLLPRLEDIGGPSDGRQWAAVLRSASALEAFRKLYGYSITVDRVVEILLFDPNFPRSARFSAERLAAAIERVAAQGASQISHQLVSDSLLALLRSGSAGQAIGEGLHEFLLNLERECSNISNSLYSEYMALG
jgi:uncharacterized alpha-E superfamily protein